MLIKGALVVDPAQALEAPMDLLLADGKIALLVAPGDHPRRGPPGGGGPGPGADPGTHRYARPPAGAGGGIQRDHRDRDPGRGAGRLHRGGGHAQHQSGERHRLGEPLYPGAGRGRRPGPGLPGGRHLHGFQGGEPERIRRPEGGRGSGRLRRRQAGDELHAHAPGPGICPHLRPAGHLPQRGPGTAGRRA